MRPLKDYGYLARDYWRYLRGTDYFRQPQGLGPHFRDDRCYYNDLTGKALWSGGVQNGVPVLFFPACRKSIVNPCMVLLWGLGSLDRYFLESKTAYLHNVQNAARWLIDTVAPEGFWDTGVISSDPMNKYYSGNSCMVQGLALSFIARILNNRLLDMDLRTKLEPLSYQVVVNMLRPIDQGGTARYLGEDLYLLEFAQVEECVVLNGWIFGLFGLWDYAARTADSERKEQLKRSVATLRRALPLFERSDGWSFYNTKGRLASPFYHDLHISLLEALFLLTGDHAFDEKVQIFKHGNSRINRVRYTVNKIREKLLDKDMYTSQA